MKLTLSQLLRCLRAAGRPRWTTGLALLGLGLTSIYAAQQRGAEAPVSAPKTAPARTVAATPSSEEAAPQLKVHWIASENFQLCQALGPAAPHQINGVDSTMSGPCGEPGWQGIGPIPWQAFAQGEYAGHDRLQHVPEYRIRVDDQLDFVYRVTREEIGRPYVFEVGDELRVESFNDPQLQRDLIVQPDGTISLRLLGQVRIAKRTVDQVRDELNELYRQYYRDPAISITPLRVDTRLEDLRASVDRRFGVGGQSQGARVTPEGTIQLPAIGSVPVQGLSIIELHRELNARYAQVVEGIEVTPILAARAPRYVYVLGEVGNPGRVEMTGPMTAIQALATAGNWRVGANLRQVVVFRRGDDWRLMATMLDLRGALYAKRPAPSDEIWLNDSDIIIVPKSPILVADEWIELVFTRGLYGVVPMTYGINYTRFSDPGLIAGS
ncbi:MAG: polysaccharide biosynthesis/export family protein [Planctomycetaceae bacterium]|nr:polysaccharide biosynthesis/export family protein [Planctomycetaceae bacterium]